MAKRANRLEAQWWSFTSEGNKALDQGDMRAARYDHEAALAIARRLFDTAQYDAKACLLAPMIHNIAAYNLAEIHRREGDIENAARHLETAMERLVATAESSRMPLALRVNCVRHLPRVAAWLAQSGHGTDGQQTTVGALFERASRARLELDREIAAHAQVDTGVLRQGIGEKTIH